MPSYTNKSMYNLSYSIQAVSNFRITAIVSASHGPAIAVSSEVSTSGDAKKVTLAEEGM